MHDVSRLRHSASARREGLGPSRTAWFGLQSFWRAHRATLVVLPRCMSWSHGLSVRAPETSAEALHHLVAAAPRLVVLTGAGCSTECGIPDYRDADGEWKRKQPVQYREFVDDEYARQRYWGRSMIGWLPFSRARPGRTHELLAQLEARGRVHLLVTQNVDGLHQRAGSQRVIDLHGSLAEVHCLICGAGISRAEMQVRLEAVNPHWTHAQAAIAPDGDVDLEGANFHDLEVPGCAVCGGVLKPNVVFHGESVPRPRVQHCFGRLAESDALLVVGSSLMLFSGYRFVRAAVQAGQPVALINLGRTRADQEADVKISAPCAEVLEALCHGLE